MLDLDGADGVRICSIEVVFIGASESDYYIKPEVGFVQRGPIGPTKTDYSSLEALWA